MRMRGSPGDKSKLRKTLQVVKKREGVAPPTDLPDLSVETLTPEEADVWEVVDRCNTAWLDGRPRDTRGTFAEDAVVVSPGLETRIEGREAVVESFVSYVASVKTTTFDVVERNVSVLGDTAVVAYVFDVTYELDGETHLERGEEVLVLRRSAAEPWRIAWRTQVPLPVASP